MLVLLSTLAWSGEPSVARYARTAMDSRKDETVRARAIVALAEFDSEEAGWALADLANEMDPDSALGRVVTAARVQTAELEELALGGWPDWALPQVEARITELVPQRCADPKIRELPLPPALVAEVCAAHLPPAELAAAVLGGAEPVVREQAARLLTALAPRDPEVEDAVVAAFAWDAPTPWAGEQAALDQLTLPEPGRHRLATELVTRRLAVVQVGGQDVPPRLDAELRAVLAPELEAYGQPTHTIDWLHLLGASGADPAVVLARLGLQTDHHYTVVIDEHLALEQPPRELLPLLAHRSPIVRSRAARRMEEQPEASIAALDRAWRFAPGRTAPLRGDVGTPRLPRETPDAMKWERTLAHWARRSSRQDDGTALRATLWFLSCPTTTRALPDVIRIELAQSLLRTARKDHDPERVADLVQGMDAILREVPFDEGARPAPEEARMALESWVRMTPR